MNIRKTVGTYKLHVLLHIKHIGNTSTLQYNINTHHKTSSAKLPLPLIFCCCSSVACNVLKVFYGLGKNLEKKNPQQQENLHLHVLRFRLRTIVTLPRTLYTYIVWCVSIHRSAKKKKRKTTLILEFFMWDFVVVVVVVFSRYSCFQITFIRTSI